MREMIELGAAAAEFAKIIHWNAAKSWLRDLAITTL
jgi:hypothetical protein